MSCSAALSPWRDTVSVLWYPLVVHSRVRCREEPYLKLLRNLNIPTWSHALLCLFYFSRHLTNFWGNYFLCKTSWVFYVFTKGETQKHSSSLALWKSFYTFRSVGSYAFTCPLFHLESFTTACSVVLEHMRHCSGSACVVFCKSVHHPAKEA